MEPGSGAYDARREELSRKETLKKRDTVKNAAAKAERDWIDGLTNESAVDPREKTAESGKYPAIKDRPSIESSPIVQKAKERALAKEADAKKIGLAKDALEARGLEIAQEKERAKYEAQYSGISAIGDSAVTEHLTAAAKKAPTKKGFLGIRFGKKDAETVFDETFAATWAREDLDRKAKLIQTQTGFSTEQSRLIAALKTMPPEQRPQAEAFLKRLSSGK